MVENVTWIKCGITINAKVSAKIPKNIHSTCKKDYICKPATCSCKNGKYVWSIDNSVITCDEIIDTTKTVLTKAVPTESTSTNFYILLIFLLIAKALLILVSIYLIKYKLYMLLFRWDDQIWRFWFW